MKISGKELLQRMLLFTQEGHNVYDAEFSAALSSVNPDWKKRRRGKNAAANKRALLKLASEGKYPVYESTLGRAIANYTKKWSKCYDEDFTTRYFKLRRDRGQCGTDDEVGVRAAWRRRGVLANLRSE